MIVTRLASKYMEFNQDNPKQRQQHKTHPNIFISPISEAYKTSSNSNNRTKTREKKNKGREIENQSTKGSERERERETTISDNAGIRLLGS